MAKKRDLIKLLSKFTTEELQGEAARRLNSKEGGEWGYLVVLSDEDDDPSDTPEFGIVRVEYWEKEHCLEDCSLGKQVTLPEGFSESMESIYFFHEGDQAKGEEILQQFGFKRLGEIDA